MQNREPTYPGRVTLTPVAGLANTYDMDRADQPLQQGTPLTKATFLKDATAALFGLGTDAVPDDVLAELGKYKQYWWRRRVNLGYQEVKTNLTSDQTVTSSSYPNLQYAKSITIDLDTEEYTLVNPKTVVCAGSRNQDVINASLQEIVNNAPCYVKSSRDLDGAQDYQLFYLPAGSTAGSSSGVTTGYTIYLNRYSSTNLYTCIPVAASGVVQAQGVSFAKYDPSQNAWEYLRSNSRSAYPDGGISGGYEYEYLGVPLDNTVTAPKIETGRYVGTGTYGQSNPNTLTFDFIPEVVIITRMSVFSYYPGNVLVNGQTYSGGIGSVNNSADAYGMTIDWTGKNVSWYAEDASKQLNNSGAGYCYFAIGR